MGDFAGKRDPFIGKSFLKRDKRYVGNRKYRAEVTRKVGRDTYEYIWTDYKEYSPEKISGPRLRKLLAAGMERVEADSSPEKYENFETVSFEADDDEECAHTILQKKSGRRRIQLESSDEESAVEEPVKTYTASRKPFPAKRRKRCFSLSKKTSKRSKKTMSSRSSRVPLAPLPSELGNRGGGGYGGGGRNLSPVNPANPAHDADDDDDGKEEGIVISPHSSRPQMLSVDDEMKQLLQTVANKEYSKMDVECTSTDPDECTPPSRDPSPRRPRPERQSKQLHGRATITVKQMPAQKPVKLHGKDIVLISLFDGCGGAAQSLLNANIFKYTNVHEYVCEKDKNALQLIEYHRKIRPRGRNPSRIFSDDVTKWSSGLVRDIVDRHSNALFLVVAGSPCQDLSCAKQNREGVYGPKSKLFWVAIDILDEIKRRVNAKLNSHFAFLFENVASMPVSDRQTFDRHLGVSPIELLGEDFSPMRRKRLFWTNMDNIIKPAINSSGDLNAVRRFARTLVKCHTTSKSCLHPDAFLDPGRKFVFGASGIGHEEFREGKKLKADDKVFATFLTSKDFKESKQHVNVVYAAHDIQTKVDPLHVNARELERLFGFSEDWTKYGISGAGNKRTFSEDERRHFLGNSFQTYQIMYLLRNLSRAVSSPENSLLLKPNVFTPLDSSQRAHVLGEKYAKMHP